MRRRAQPGAALLLLLRGDRVVRRGGGARSRRVREDVHLRQPGLAHRCKRRREGALVLGREADDDVARQVELALKRRQPAEIRRDGITAPHRTEHAVVAGLERDVQVRAHGRCVAQGVDERVVHVVDLDRREAEPLEPGCRAGLAHEPRQVVAGRPVAVAAEVDAGEHDLAMPLIHAAGDLGEYRVRTAAARRAADERDHAEVAREAATVLHLDERAHPVEARVRLDATDRADVAGDEGRCFLAAARDDDDVVRQPCEGVGGEVGTATGDVDALVRARRARRLLARLGNGLVRDAARVDDRDVRPVVELHVAVGEQALAHVVRVDVRDLAAQEVDRERGHSPGRLIRRARTGRLPSLRGRCARAGASR